MQTELNDYIDGKGRMDYGMLLRYLQRKRIDDFAMEVRHPFLMGKALYNGKFEERQSANNTNTMAFHKATLFKALPPIVDPTQETISQLDFKPQGADVPGGISRAIFMLMKSKDTPGLPNEIYLGRSRNNDLIIADYAVSKAHAMIKIFYQRYFITDLNSTNGTYVNDEQLVPQVEYPLPADSDIAFGRLVFRFISPRELHSLLST